MLKEIRVNGLGGIFLLLVMGLIQCVNVSIGDWTWFSFWGLMFQAFCLIVYCVIVLYRTEDVPYGGEWFTTSVNWFNVGDLICVTNSNDDACRIVYKKKYLSNSNVKLYLVKR